MPDDKNLNNGGQGNGGAGAGGTNNQQNQNNQGGDKGGAGAGDGGNKAGGAGSGQGQGGNNNGGAGAGDETVTIKKSDLEKLNKDLDTYRERVTGKKAGEFSLENNGGQGGNGDGSGSGSGAAPALDEKKVEEIVTRTTSKQIHKANEKTAIKQFLKTHLDYTDEKEWQALLPYLPAGVNKDDPAAIVDALEGAVLLHKRATGKLDDYMKEQADRARREGEMNTQVNLGFSGGGVGGKANQGNQTDKPAESTIEMGKRFGHSAETIEQTLKETPKGPEGGFQIDVTQKPAKK